MPHSACAVTHICLGTPLQVQLEAVDVPNTGRATIELRRRQQVIITNY